ncbi:MAG: cobalamin biosynthesis protein CobQ [Pseudomonadota bacterium]
MNTPVHLIVGWAAFGRRERPRETVAAIAGGLAPDLSLYLLVLWAWAIEGRTARQIFGEDYFSPAWQAVFAVDNSVFVWSALLAAGLAGRIPWFWAFAGAALLHLALDLPLHAGDGRPHFWPISDWVFDSPVSYWDVNHHAAIIAPLETLLALVLAALIARRHWPQVLPLAFVAILLIPQLMVSGFWTLVFSTL